MLYFECQIRHRIYTLKGKAMNYIQQLQERIKELELELEQEKQKAQDIAVYLALPKFSEDTSVSKYDILRMLERY